MSVVSDKCEGDRAEIQRCKGFMSIQGVHDVNADCVIGPSAGIVPGGTDARWHTGVRSRHGVRALAHR